MTPMSTKPVWVQWSTYSMIALLRRIYPRGIQMTVKMNIALLRRIYPRDIKTAFHFKMVICFKTYHHLDTTLCNKVCQWLTTGRLFSLGALVSSTNKTDRHNITEILLKVALNTITLTRTYCVWMWKKVKNIFKLLISVINLHEKEIDRIFIQKFNHCGYQKYYILLPTD
jgi:hypothetical protein